MQGNSSYLESGYADIWGLDNQIIQISYIRFMSSRLPDFPLWMPEKWGFIVSRVMHVNMCRHVYSKKNKNTFFYVSLWECVNIHFFSSSLVGCHSRSHLGSLASLHSLLHTKMKGR